jgi:hypothetical protein
MRGWRECRAASGAARWWRWRVGPTGSQSAVGARATARLGWWRGVRLADRIPRARRRRRRRGGWCSGTGTRANCVACHRHAECWYPGWCPGTRSHSWWCERWCRESSTRSARSGSVLSAARSRGWQPGQPGIDLPRGLRVVSAYGRPGPGRSRGTPGIRRNPAPHRGWRADRLSAGEIRQSASGRRDGTLHGLMRIRLLSWPRTRHS